MLKKIETLMQLNSFVVEVYDKSDLIYSSQPLPLDNILEIYRDCCRKYQSGLVGGGENLEGIFQIFPWSWFQERMRVMKNEFGMSDENIIDFIMGVFQESRKGHMTVRYRNSQKQMSHAN